MMVLQLQQPAMVSPQHQQAPQHALQQAPQQTAHQKPPELPKARKDMDLADFLKYARLEKYEMALQNSGFEEVVDLEHAADASYSEAKLLPVEVARLKRKLQEFLVL